MIIVNPIIDQVGNKRWFKDGRLHREDGPAVEYCWGAAEYYINGVRHRLDGPAIIRKNGNNKYYINGINYNELEFFIQTGHGN